MMGEPRVTVLTPFHNTEAYLAQCLESVLAQTYGNWDYVLVDNQSTDGSLRVAEGYARRDSRIRVHRTSTLLDQDRNYSEALRLVPAESRYIKVVQADDWIFPRCLEEMVAIAEAHPRVGLVGSYYLKGTKILGWGLPYPSPAVPGRTLCRLQLLDDLYFMGSPTSLLMRAEVARAHFPFFASDVLHADTEACYRTLREWDFGFVHQVLSFLRTDDASRMGAVRDFMPHYLDKYIILTNYGSDFLSAEELAATMRRQHHVYFRMLGEAVITGRPPEFWAYHRRGLATIGYDLRWHRLWKYILMSLAEFVFNPLNTLLRLRGWLAGPR